MDSLFAGRISLIQIHHPQELNIEKEKSFMLSFSDVGLWMLRFQDMNSHTFDLRLERQIWVTGAIATAVLRTPDDSSVSGQPNVHSLKANWHSSIEGTDRIKWLWPKAMLWILVNIRAEIIDGRAACVVHLSYQTPEEQGINATNTPKPDAPLPRRIRKGWLLKGLNSQSPRLLPRLLPAPRIVPVESTRGFIASGYMKPNFAAANEEDSSELQKHKSI